MILDTWLSFANNEKIADLLLALTTHNTWIFKKGTSQVASLIRVTSNGVHPCIS